MIKIAWKVSTLKAAVWSTAQHTKFTMQYEPMALWFCDVELSINLFEVWLTQRYNCKVVGNLWVLTIEIERILFREVRILGDTAFAHKPNDHQHGEPGISPVCVVRVSRPPYLKKAYRIDVMFPKTSETWWFTCHPVDWAPVFICKDRYQLFRSSDSIGYNDSIG